MQNEELVSLLSSFKKNFSFWISFFSKINPDSRLISELNPTAFKHPISDSTFNFIVGMQKTEVTDSEIANLLELYRKESLPLSWWIQPCEEPKNLSSRLSSEGFHLVEKYRGMYLPLNEPKKSKTSSLSFRRVNTDREMRDFCKLITIFGIPSTSYENFYSKIPLSYLESGPYELYIGYHDQKPVVCGAIVFHADIAGIYYLATAPEERKKGYATEMLTCLFDRAKQQNYEIAVLQASKSGKSLYKKLGFRDLDVEESHFFEEWELKP